MTRRNRKSESLGKLSLFGLAEPWQVALFLPHAWDDLRYPLEDFSLPVFEGQKYLVKGLLRYPPKIDFKGAPRLIGCLFDEKGYKLGFSAFGDTRDLQAEIKAAGERLTLYGTIATFNGSPWLKDIELIRPAWVNRLRPCYPGKTRVIRPETVRQRVFQHLRNAVPFTATWLAQELAEFGSSADLAAMAGCPEWTLETLLRQAHLPKEEEDGRKAQEGLEILASFGIIRAARSNRRDIAVSPQSLGDWRRRAPGLPFDLSGEQYQAVTEVLGDLQSGTPMRRILTGDVGTGKTAVYALAVACVVDGGGRAAILMPNQPLADQVANEFRQWWPDIPVELVTGESRQINLSASVLVGTTALLFQDEIKDIDLVVVDEQQKMARHQREQLVSDKGHLLEVSATAIPRSQALIRYGVLKTSRLKECHTEKTIHTRIWYSDQKQELFTGIRSTLSAGQQVLVVYPLREEKEEESSESNRMVSVEEAYRLWSRAFPRERIVSLHGQMTNGEKEAGLREMKAGRASICLATSIAEVGLNIPNLMRVVVMFPERFGLTTLHQIRGRVARLGGVGYCDLYLPYSVKEKTMERLRVLERTADGFEVAEWDMKLRGVGDLGSGSNKQSGADETFLFGRSVRMDLLDLAMQKLA